MASIGQEGDRYSFILLANEQALVIGFGNLPVGQPHVEKLTQL
jgi:hypothetical protein